MLKYAADLRSLAFLGFATCLLFIQWNLETFHPLLWLCAMFFAVTVAVIAHNHNHVPMWKSEFLNRLTDYWITLFYGFPTFAWIPTHNKNHHKFNNKPGDYTITYRFSEDNNLWTLLSYPSISSYYQQIPIAEYLKKCWQKDRGKFWFAISQYVVLAAMILTALILDWKKAVLYILLPHQAALFTVLIFNYLQHVHADEASPTNHSRNFTSPILNFLLFNNGYHTVHHDNANLHWSKWKDAHDKIAHTISPRLIEKSFWGYLFRTYILGAFMDKYKSQSLRLERLQSERAGKDSKSAPSMPQAVSAV